MGGSRRGGREQNRQGKGTEPHLVLSWKNRKIGEEGRSGLAGWGGLHCVFNFGGKKLKPVLCSLTGLGGRDGPQNASVRG